MTTTAVPESRIPWGDPKQVEAFERFFARMPDDQRDFAIKGLAAVGLPTSQEFLKAYSVGVAVVMAAFTGRRLAGSD